jgi:hypothetical protein
MTKSTDPASAQFRRSFGTLLGIALQSPSVVRLYLTSINHSHLITYDIRSIFIIIYGEWWYILTTISIFNMYIISYMVRMN